MAANITTTPTKILEKTTPKLTAVIKDEAGQPIASSSLATLTLTYYNKSDSAYSIINTRNAQDVLNQNNVSVDGSGNLIWQLQTADTAVLDSTLKEEIHRAVFEWTYGTPTKTGRHVIDMTVLNLEKVA